MTDEGPRVFLLFDEAVCDACRPCPEHGLDGVLTDAFCHKAFATLAEAEAFIRDVPDFGGQSDPYVWRINEVFLGADPACDDGGQWYYDRSGRFIGSVGLGAYRLDQVFRAAGVVWPADRWVRP